MKHVLRRQFAVASFCAVLFLDAACNKKEESPPDHPRLTARVTMRDVTFHSADLDRDMPYRVVLPVNIAPRRKLPVVYVLHGGGGGFRGR